MGFYYPPGYELPNPKNGGATDRVMVCFESAEPDGGREPIIQRVDKVINIVNTKAPLLGQDPEDICTFPPGCCQDLICEEVASGSYLIDNRYVRNGLAVYAPFTFGVYTDLAQITLGDITTDVDWYHDATPVNGNYYDGDCEIPEGQDHCTGPCTLPHPCAQGTLGGGVNFYEADLIDGNPVLTGTPGDGSILWEWTPVDTFDVRIGIEYGVSVVADPSTPAAAPANQKIADNQWLSTGLVNGTLYKARVQAFLAVDFNGIADNTAAPGGRSISNIASATPSAAAEALPTIDLSSIRFRIAG